MFTPEQLEALVKTFGADHVVLGTDYPFDMADFDPIEHVVASGFDASTTAAISGGNAKKLLGLSSACIAASARAIRAHPTKRTGSPGQRRCTMRRVGSGPHRSRKSSTAVSAITACALLWRPERACSSCVRVACR